MRKAKRICLLCSKPRALWSVTWNRAPYRRRWWRMFGLGRRVPWTVLVNSILAVVEFKILGVDGIINGVYIDLE